MPPRAKKTDKTSSYRVQVLDRAADILECFTYRRRELSLPQIVEMTGLNRSTARRLVVSLERRGLFQEDPTTGLYRLGLRLFEMGGIVFASFSLREAAAAPLSVLEKQLNATILLAARSKDHFVIVDRRDGVAMVSMPSEIGTVRPITYGPIGRVLLSPLSEEAVRELLTRFPSVQHTPHSITDTGELLERLFHVAECGYAVDVEGVVEGIMAIAAPILDFSGKTVGALCLGLPATKEKDTEYVETALRCLKEASLAISANMGYAGSAEPASAANEVPAEQDVLGEEPGPEPVAASPAGGS